MRYYIQLDSEPETSAIEIELNELSDGKLDVKLEGQQVDVDIVGVFPQLSIIVDGQVTDLTTEGTPPKLGVIASGNRSYVYVQSERTKAASLAKRRGDASATQKWLRTPMAGRVVKVLAKVGDEVPKGGALVVIEAMKMENEFRAQSTVKIAEIFVSVGMSLEANANLIRFE